jgi:GNAT superfamily N-acetyltransferase
MTFEGNRMREPSSQISNESTSVFRLVFFDESTVSASSIREVLDEIDMELCPPLHARTDLDQYVRKLITRSDTIFALGNHRDLLGFIVFYLTNRIDEYAYWTLLAVRPAHRRKGVGMALSKAMVECCRKGGVRGILAKTWESHSVTPKIFSSLGFVRYGDLEARPSTREMSVSYRLDFVQ